MANKGFFCLDGYLKRTAKLSDQELGRLFRACMVYHATGEVTELAGRESVAFDFIREDIDAANEAYEAKCETNRRNRTGTTDNDRQRPSTTDDEAQPEPTKCNELRNKNEKEIVKENKKNSPSLLFGFDQFWAAYPRKTAKPDAVKAYGKIKPDEALLAKILTAIEKQKQTAQWQEDGGRFVPYPATWLNGHRWEDEVQAAPAGGSGPAPRPVVAQVYEQREYDLENERPEEMLKRLQAEMEGA